MNKDMSERYENQINVSLKHELLRYKCLEFCFWNKGMDNS